MSMLVDARLEADLARPLSASLLVLVVQLDTGRVVLGPRSMTLGHDQVLAALTDISDGGETWSAAIVADALDEVARAAWWINRAASVIEITPDMGSVFDGRTRFTGIIAAEPDDTAGVWSLQLAPPRRRVVPVPDLGIVTSTDWPDAAPDVVGRSLPEVFGTVEGCPLLAVQTQATTTLAVAAQPGQAQLEVADASVLASSGSIIIDGRTYAYTHRTDAALLGMDITAAHGVGTLVAQAGSSVFLAAGHAVTAITDLRADDARIEGGTVSLSAATVTFDSPPSVVASATRYNTALHFDAIDAGNTASNAANAIRAILGTHTQSGTPSGTATAAAPATIAFARPPDGYRIISGVYSVAFTVAVGTQVGSASVRIGPDLVWSYKPGIGVLFNASPVAITFDDDADQLPVSVEVESGGSTDQVTVTIVSASRVVATGNLDEANFATIAPGQSLKVRQTTENPDLGRIAKPRLAVRWFATDATLGTASVKLGGVTLGPLSLTPNSGASLSRTITVSSVTQGAASFPSTPVSTSATKTDSNVAATINAPIAYTVAKTFSGSPPYVIMYPIDLEIALPPGVVAGTYSITLQLNPNSDGSSAYSDTAFQVGTATPQTLFTGSPPASLTFSVALSANQSTLRIRHGTNTSFAAWPTDFVDPKLQPTIKYVSGSITTQPTAAALTVSASSANLNAASLSNSGISVALANNSISFSVPAPPRVLTTLFELPTYDDWSDFGSTGSPLVAEITLTGGTASLCVVETYLSVEYDEIIRVPAEQVTASVTGRDGNPGAVLLQLAAASGQTLEPVARRRLADWCDAAGLVFARRCADPADALQLLQFAAEQAGVLLAEQDGMLAPVRWLDLAGTVPIIRETDLLAPARIGWADRVETQITLRYAEDYTADGFTRVTQASAATTAACRLGEAEIADSRLIDIDGGWLRDDTAAGVALAAHVGRYARPRRVLTLECPYSITARAGELIEYVPHGGAEGEGVLARIVRRAESNGWPVLEAEEIVGVR